MIRNLHIALSALALGAAPIANGDTGVIRSGINQEILSNALDPGDMKIILENIMKTAVFGELQHKTQLYQDGDALLQGLEREEFDVFAMTTLRYIRDRHLDIEPTLVLQSSGKKWNRYVMLVNSAKSEGKTLADYKGAQVTMLDNGVTDLIRLWIDVALGEKGLPQGEDFFSEIAVAEKPNQAAIPVFFGKKEMCVISEENWEMLAILNPKMKERLKPIAASPKFVPGVLLYRGGTDPAIKQRSKDALLRMHQSPEGEQILRFGQIEQIVPVEPKDLQPAIDVYLEYERMWGNGVENLAAENVGGEPN